MLRTLSTVLLLSILCGSARTTPLERWDQARPGRERLTPASETRALKTLLDCESDMNVTPANTLVLNQGDLAGVLLPLPTPNTSFRIRGATLGFYDTGALLPTDIAILIYQSSGTLFDFVAGFTLTLQASTTHVDLDLRPFEVDVSGELLLFYGQDPAAGLAKIFPAGDASPRCAPVDACSVLLPAGSTTFVDYGRVDGLSCPDAPGNFLHLDLVAELDVLETALPVESTSWSALKARY